MIVHKSIDYDSRIQGDQSHTFHNMYPLYADLLAVADMVQTFFDVEVCESGELVLLIRIHRFPRDVQLMVCGKMDNSMHFHTVDRHEVCSTTMDTN